MPPALGEAGDAIPATAPLFCVIVCFVARDWGLEWRLVPAKARESCRWQSVDGAWVSVTLGHQKDITKVVVAASDGRTEVVDGYEEGLNVARRWRASWSPKRSSDASAPEEGRFSRTSGAFERAAPLTPGLGRRSPFSRPLSEEPTEPAARLSERGLGGPGRPRAASRPDLPGPPEDSYRSGWSAPDGRTDPKTRTLPPRTGSSSEPTRSARATPARPLPDLSRSFPAGPRPEPPPRWSTGLHREVTRPTEGREPSRSAPPSSRPPAPELGTDASRPSLPSRDARKGRSSGAPSADLPGDEFSGGSSQVPLPPLVPERLPSGPYPVLERTDHGDGPADPDALERLRRLSRPPRR